MGHPAHRQTDRHLGHVPPELAVRRAASGQRPLQQAAGPRPPRPTSGRADPGRHAGGQRPAQPSGGAAPSVYPVQPEQVGVFRDATAGPPRWKTSEGPDRHRRGIYTFWQRMYPYPSLVLFDAPSRERSCVRRARSNTPLQALVLLNDPVAFEAARGVRRPDPFRSSAGHGCRADRVRLRDGAVPGARRGRVPALPLVPAGAARTVREQSRGCEGRRRGLRGLATPHPPAAELATWTMAASTILALDEAITKQ